MKRVISLVMTAILSAVVFSSCNSKEIAQQNAPVVSYVDSLRYFTGGPEYAPEMNVNADSVANVWKKFSNYFIKGKYEKAYKYFNEDKAEGAILVYLRNTTAQYEFYNCMLEPVLDFNCDDKTYFDELMSSFNLNLEMIKMVIASAWARGAEEEDVYIPPHYTELVMSMAQMKLYYEQYDDALSFADEIVAAYEMSGYDSVLSQLAALDFITVVKMHTEGKESALAEIDSFKKKYVEGTELEKEEQIEFALDFITKQLDDIENEEEEIDFEDFE